MLSQSSSGFNIAVNVLVGRLETCQHGSCQRVALQIWTSRCGPFDSWGHDARVQLAVGNAKVNIERHTEGRGETSRAMLDLSMSGLTDMVDTIGWAWTVPCTQVNLQLGVREHTVHQETDHVTS